MNTASLLGLFFILALAPASVAKEKPVYKMLPDGTTVLRGMSRVTTYDLANATCSCCEIGPVGIKGVDVGDTLYVYDEKNKERLRDAKINNQGELTICGPDTSSKTNYSDKGWPAWYGGLANVLAENWQANVPGQLLVLLEIKRDGTIRVAQKLTFIPAEDKDGNFANNSSLPDLEAKFCAEFEAALTKIKFANLVFPPNSTASAAIVSATLVADHDLFVTGQRLANLHLSPYTSEQLKVWRIATILEAGCMYDVAALLRTPNTSQTVVPRDRTRHLISDNDALVPVGGVSYMPSLGKQRSQTIESILNRYLKQQDYLAAEQLAKALAAKRNQLKDFDIEVVRHLKIQNRNTEIETYAPENRSEKN